MPYPDFIIVLKLDALAKYKLLQAERVILTNVEMSNAAKEVIALQSSKTDTAEKDWAIAHKEYMSAIASLAY